MPTYCYTSDSGKTLEWVCRMACIPQSLFSGGVTFVRDLVAEHTSTKSGDAWVEHYSLAMMVLPQDVPFFQKDAKEKGLGHIDFNEQGMPHFTDDKHQKRYAEAYGFRQLNSYY